MLGMESFGLSVEEKDCKLLFIKNRIHQVVSFLAQYLPLANAHNSDFIVSHHWDTLVPVGIASDLLSLNDQELCLMPNGRPCRPVDRLEPVSAVVHVDNTGTFLHDISDLDSCKQSADPVSFSDELQQKIDCTPINLLSDISSEDEFSGFARIIPDNCVEKSNSSHMYYQSSNHVSTWSGLTDFVDVALSNTLPRLDVLTSATELRARLKLSPDEDRVVVSSFMNIKKAYEVDIMTGLCAELARRYLLTNVFDIGTGRGYLGCHLALMHGLRVIGVDSSSSNTGSAATRTRHLQKQWRGLAKISRQTVKNGQPAEHNGDVESIRADVASLRVDDNPAGVLSNSSGNVSHERSQDESRKLSDSLYKPITTFVDSETNLDELMDTCWSTPSSTDHSQCRSPRYMLTGLHTCGNLSANVLRIFASRPRAVVVCQVGCCYNLLDERFRCSPYVLSDGGGKMYNAEPGFPMCEVLTSSLCQLGRNALMLASHSPERSACSLQLPPESIYWRSLLQVVLRDVVGCVKNDWCVGKIAANCRSFEEYAHKALKILGLNTEITDEQLTEYKLRYADQARKNVAFFQLKTVLAPCIEALVLLDRLAFLLEQHDVADAHIVPLFDAVKSPRRYAIIAVKCMA